MAKNCSNCHSFTGYRDSVSPWDCDNSNIEAIAFLIKEHDYYAAILCPLYEPEDESDDDLVDLESKNMAIEVVSMRGGLSEELGFPYYRVDRGTKLGNPFEMRNEGERDLVIKAYRRWLWNVLLTKSVDPTLIVERYNVKIADTWRAPSVADVMLEIIAIAQMTTTHQTVRLVCWCAPKPCHADVIANAVNWVLEHIVFGNMPAEARTKLMSRLNERKSA